MKINEFLDYASKKYYEGHPIISDEEFDSLSDKYEYKPIGYQVPDDGIEHLFPLFSLQKVFEGELTDPLEKYWEHERIIVTPKLDGAAVSLIYNSGRLIQAVTRGDGKKGLDITEKMAQLVPETIKSRTDLIQISGELVAPKTIPNARNYAAGALNLKDLSEFVTREVTFIVYDVKPSNNRTWSQDVEELQEFPNVLQEDWTDFPQDGKVFRLDDNKLFEKLGHTSHHPRAAYALKPKPTGVVTTLLDVIWQVGKTGVVSPVAILDPVIIDNATVSRATLHNMRYIEELSLELGCNVEVIRSGEIIPRVLRRVE